MKKIFLSTVLLLTQSLKGESQIVSQLTYLVVNCCSDVDSVDVENDGQFDISISSHFVIDGGWFQADTLQSNYLISPATLPDSSFSWFFGIGTIAQSTFFCDWNSFGYFPESGFRYIGFKRINAPNDTTYGWVKINFLGPPADCSDSVVILGFAYDTVSNEPITAGQLFPSAILNLIGSSWLELRQYTHDEIHLINHSSINTTCVLFNAIGQLQRVIFIPGNSEFVVSLENNPSGIYFLKDLSSNFVRKIVRY